MQNVMKKQLFCHHCEGKGYIEIRDCSAEIQREETCVFCEETGKIYDQFSDSKNDNLKGAENPIGVMNKNP